MAAKKKKKRNKILIVIIILLVVGALATGGWLVYRKLTDPYISYEVSYTEQLTANAATKYVPYPEGYVRISRDGAEAVDSMGALLWNVSFSMNSPLYDISGQYAAFGDFEGRVLYITDGTGTVNTVEVPYNLSEIECASNGVVAARMQDGSDDFIRIVSFSGELLVDIKTTEAENGFPLDMDLSSDGARLVTSYLAVDGDNASGRITFYNFGGVGQNYSNKMTGVFKYDKVAPRVDFIDANNVCAFFDDGIKLYSCPEIPALSKEIICTDPILCADSGDGVVVIMESGKSTQTVSHTQAYDAKGNRIFESTSNDNLKAVMIFGKSFLFYNDYACQIVGRDNVVHYNGNFDSRQIKQLISVNGRDKLMVFEENAVSTMQLVKSVKSK